MILITGLGNPGTAYLNSRHNIGWQVADLLQKKLQFDPFKPEQKFHTLITAGTYCGHKVVIIKPLTFMNLAGKAVYQVINFYKIKPSSLWVIYDDLDLPLGQLRIRKEGGPGTHNGMRSIVTSIGTSKFPRFRVGIESRGETTPNKQTARSFVLNDFNQDEKAIITTAKEKTVDAIITAICNNLDTAMNIYNH